MDNKVLKESKKLGKEAGKDLYELTKTPKQEVKNQEAFRLAQLIFKNSYSMTTDYRNTIKRTGGLLTSSMAYAYSKGINDIVKLLMKESTHEQKESDSQK